MHCKVFSVIVLASTALQVWHVALLPVFNMHYSELSTHHSLVFPIMPIMCFILTWMRCFQHWCRKMCFWVTERAAIEVLGKCSWYILYIIVEGKQVCSYASKHQMNFTHQWMQSFILSAEMDWLCTKISARVNSIHADWIAWKLEAAQFQ